MKYLTIFLLTLSPFQFWGQKRIELIETNIPQVKFSAYGDSYLWTKNWWLTSSIIVDVNKGGNAIASNSILAKRHIDSLSKAFRQYLSPDLIRFGNLMPRINFNNNKKLKPYIKSSIYEFDDKSAHLLGQFIITFGDTTHNSMPDVSNILIFDPEDLVAYPVNQLLQWYRRPPSILEKNLMGPGVTRN